MVVIVVRLESLMSIKKYTDWRSWLQGLQTNIIKCIGTTGTAWLGTNAASAAGVPIVGITWKQALAMFGVHIGFEVFTYMKNVQPQAITETTESAMKATSADGSEVSQSVKTVTTTPVPPAQPTVNQI